MLERILSAGHIVTAFIVFVIAFGLGLFAKRHSLLRSIIIDEEKKTIRGSWINFVFTLLIGILIGIGAFRTPVAENLTKMETLIIAVYAASFGIYTIRQGYTAYLNKGNGGSAPPPTE